MIYYIFFLYLCLVIIDVILPRIPKFISKNYNQAQEIIKKRTQLDILEFNKLQEKKFIRQIWVSDYQIYPFTNAVKKSNFVAFSPPGFTKYILCSEGNGVITYTSDRFGFRNIDDKWDLTNDAVLIGDSFAEGQCVEDQYTIVGYLNKNNIKTIRLAHGGLSALHYDFYVRTFIPYLKPKILIIALHENDNHLIDTVEIHSKFAKVIKPEEYINITKNKINPSGKLNNFNIEILKINKFFNQNNNNFFGRFVQIFDKLKKYFLLTNTRQHFQSLFSKNLIGANKKLIDHTVSTCKQYNCRPIFILVRSSKFWDPMFFYENYKRNLTNYLKKYNLNLKDFDDILDYTNINNYAPKGPHFSIRGHSLISEKVFQLVKNKL